MGEEKVYKKLAEVQKKLLNYNFRKSGKNSFSNFNYYELEDILPTIQKVCLEEDLLLEFTFSHDEATLKIRDVNNPERIISNRMPMPAINQINKGMNIMQSLGAYITYLKRYLLLNTFLICEKDVIENLNNTKEEFKTANEDVPLNPDSNAAAKITEIKEELSKVSNKEVTTQRIKMRAKGMKNRKEITPEMYEEIESALVGA